MPKAHCWERGQQTDRQLLGPAKLAACKAASDGCAQPASLSAREVCSQEYTSLLRQTSQQNLFPLLKLLTPSQLQPQPLTLPENNDFISSFLPPFVLLETDAAVILLWGKASGDRGSQVTQGPVEIVV